MEVSANAHHVGQWDPSEGNDSRPGQLPGSRTDLDRYFQLRVHERDDTSDLVQNVSLRLFEHEGQTDFENL